MRQSFDYVSFKDILSSTLGSGSQSVLARGTGINVATLNNWCSSRAGNGPSAANRKKIDSYLKENGFDPIDWSSLLLPEGTNIEEYHQKLKDSNVGSIIDENSGTSLIEQNLDLELELIKVKKFLNEKDLENIQLRESLLLVKSENYKLKKQIEAMRTNKT